MRLPQTPFKQNKKEGGEMKKASLQIGRPPLLPGTASSRPVYKRTTFEMGRLSAENEQGEPAIYTMRCQQTADVALHCPSASLYSGIFSPFPSISPCPPESRRPHRASLLSEDRHPFNPCVWLLDRYSSAAAAGGFGPRHYCHVQRQPQSLVSFSLSTPAGQSASQPDPEGYQGTMQGWLAFYTSARFT